MLVDFLMLSRTELETFCVLGRRDNRYTTAPELSQVASFSCFADLDFYQQCICRKLRKIFACLNLFSSHVRQFFLELVEIYFSTNKFLVQSLFVILMVVDFLMLSRIDLENICMLGRLENSYTTAPQLSQVASFSCFADLDFLSSVHL